jgi:hypothetical protein
MSLASFSVNSLFVLISSLYVFSIPLPLSDTTGVLGLSTILEEEKEEERKENSKNSPLFPKGYTA